MVGFFIHLKLKQNATTTFRVTICDHHLRNWSNSNDFVSIQKIELGTSE